MSRLIQDPPSHERPTREQLLEDLQHSQSQVVRLLESIADVQDWQPEPAEWSFRLLAAHLATVEQTCHFQRVMGIASGDTPYFGPYIHRNIALAHADLRDSLQQWIAARRRLLGFVAGLSSAQMTYIGVHAAVGPMTVLDALQEILEQDQGNLRHVRQLILAYYEEALQTQRV